jgi:hypothetical protein
MATLRKEIALRDQSFNFNPTTLAEAQEYAMIFANSGMCPSTYRGKPNDILLIWQMGSEIGLGKMASLRTIGCINGVPFAFGDGLVALVKVHPQFEDIREWTEGSLEEGTLTAFCTVKRRKQEPTTQKFSIEDAKRAKLWGKPGSWSGYQPRMLQCRARTFALRDAFPDALFGLISQQEAEDMQPVNVKPITVKGKGISGLESTLGINDEVIIEGEIEIMSNETENATDKELLDLLIEKNVPHKNIAMWCAQFDVSAMSDIPEEGKQKIINYLKEKQ